MTAPGADRPPPPATAAPTERWPLHTRIFVGLVLGILLGLLANFVGARPALPTDSSAAPTPVASAFRWIVENVAEPVGKLFLRLVVMVVLPLVFSALALGVLEIGAAHRLGRVGLKTLGYTVLLSSTAVALGIFFVNTIKPGAALSDAQRARLQQQYGSGAEVLEKARRAKPLRETLLDLVPENPLQEMVGALDGSSKGNGMLAVMVFALIFGVAMSAARAKTAVLAACLDGVLEASMVIIQFAMRLAPVAVGCLVFALTARLGFEILATLFWLVLTVVLGLAVHLVVVYSLVLRFLGKQSPGAFFRAAQEVMLTAFGTSSSNASLPTALRVAEEKLHLSKPIAQFVLTIGATGNQNGTALYEGVVILFLAQVFGVELTLAQQLTVVIMAVLAGIGTAGVPGGSLPMIVIVLQSVGIPGAGIGMILGIDRLLDMCRTVLNVTGDLVIAACIDRTEPVALVEPRAALPSAPMQVRTNPETWFGDT